MNKEHDEIPQDAWIPVSKLAAAELTTRRQVYAAIDAGMPHFRRKSRIRVRRSDWNRWHEAHVVSVGGAS